MSSQQPATEDESPHDESSQDESSQDESSQDESPEDETRRRFREALAAKQGRRGQDHLDAGQAAGHAHGQVDAKRTFRRKTG